MRPLQAIIDLNAIAHNLAIVRKLAPHAKLAAAVKANAYGHGAVQVLPAFADADCLAVAMVEEALELRDGGWQKPILLLEGIFEPCEYELCARFNLDCVIHSQWQLDALAKSNLNRKLTIWLKHDSGMGRLGLHNQGLLAAISALQALPLCRQPIHLLTHFASADDQVGRTVMQQWQRFLDAAQDRNMPLSAANSAGILFHPATHADIVRPGIMNYGAAPSPTQQAASFDLIPAMTLQTRIIAIRKVNPGDEIGYGGNWTARRESVIATAAVGYGDGYPRHASNRAEVLVRGQRAPLAGRVSMDMIGIDVTDIPDATIHDDVVLWGPELPAEQLALAAGTIPYELFCGITNRVRKIYQPLNKS